MEFKSLYASNNSKGQPFKVEYRKDTREMRVMKYAGSWKIANKTESNNFMKHAIIRMSEYTEYLDKQLPRD